MKLWFSVFMLAGLLGSGCGRSDTFYAGDDDHFVVIEHSSLPSGFYDQSVNHADVSISSGALLLRLRGGAADAGAFNDSSLVGNVAAVGLSKYESSKLSDFALSVQSSSTTTSDLQVRVIADLKCDGTLLRTLLSDVSVGSSTLDKTGNWTVADHDIVGSSSNVLVSTSASSTLDALLSEYPSACLKNGIGEESDAPASIPVASLRISIGSGSSTSVEEVSISSLTVNGDVYQTWSSQ